MFPFPDRLDFVVIHMDFVAIDILSEVVLVGRFCLSLLMVIVSKQQC